MAPGKGTNKESRPSQCQLRSAETRFVWEKLEMNNCASLNCRRSAYPGRRNEKEVRSIFRCKTKGVLHDYPVIHRVTGRKEGMP